ncbi:SusC/RagA family TonB-linked outer membrane protein [Catalinimonas niigatensis]|uniref:SusC/RagA family TonB-linked outer membrane protein n=1 Tax=Catalinimonas niigatensis TaxID=1397264 RepID=UPI002665E9F4|nr:SusC/RagA family TonB-linked outer membrane protein [Catalinimonas niigatensis]WPP50070.1 SusC/RagA family TonB-linked outer membrane protein [Catalinimonas niigatensis]
MKQLYLCCHVCMMFLLVGTQAWAQNYTISGRVTDASSQDGLAGVNVVVEGTTTGTITDLDGNYRLQLSQQNPTLVFSFIGYLSKKISVTDGQTTVNVNLEEDVTNLEEVVVTGLASSVKRSNLANAVSTVSAEELVETTSPQTLDNALYGKVPGVNMVANGGAPGGGINVQLRGISTLGAGSSQPLYIIDGVYVDNSTIQSGRTLVSGAGSGSSNATQDDASSRIADLNPDDIESIEILKGPSAAAIYGTRANAGVIIITTKRGKAGQTKVSLKQDIGFAQALNLLGTDPWNPAKINTFYGEGTQQAEQELEAYNQAVSEGRITDWEEEFYGETGLLTNTQLSISGGDAKTLFYVSGGVRSEEGIIKNTGFDRYSFRGNLEHKLTDNITIKSGSNYVRSKTQRGFTGNQNDTGGSIGYNIAYLPSYADIFPNAQGDYPINPYFNDNPLAIRDLGVNESEVDRFIQSFDLAANLWSNNTSFLTLSARGGIDYLSSNGMVYFPEILQHQQALANPGDIVISKQDNFNTNFQTFLTFNTTVGDNINFNTQVGTVRLFQTQDILLNRGVGLSGGQTSLRWAKVTSVLAQEEQHITDVGLVAQEEVNWDDKIIGTLGVRFDKSTLNRDQEKFYPFPKASLAVNISNFDFWNVQAVNQLKVRAAYGETGGLPKFGRTFASLTPQLIGNRLGGQVAAGTLNARDVDPNLVPETATELEFGVDASFLDGRLGLEFTYYNKEVRDLILDLQPAESTGITAIATNAADLTNKGIEIALNTYPVRTQNFSWFSKFIYWRNESEITRLDIPEFLSGSFGGGSLGKYLVAEGFSPTTVVGTPVDTESGRLTVFGDGQPDFQMSFFNQINFLRNFDLTFLFHWKSGGENINLTTFLTDGGGTTTDWSADSDGDGIPNGRDRTDEFGPGAARFISDASYVKLRELGLYYTLPQGVVENSFIDRVKLGVSGNNLLLWSDYPSYDPEVSNFGSDPLNATVEVTPFPSSRRIFFHVQLDF